MTQKGRECLILWVSSLILIILGFVFDAMSKPNGELDVYYQVESCLSKERSFAVTGVSYFDVFVMRGAPADGEQPGTACSVTPGLAPVTSITLEEDDGFRKDGKYASVLALPEKAYAITAFSIVDAEGSVVLPTAVVSLGPDEAYPWAVEASAISYPTASPPSTAAPSPTSSTKATTPTCKAGGSCDNTCSYSFDGTCDDGGANSAYSVCSLGKDCADCGCRYPAGEPSRRRLLYASTSIGDADADEGAAASAAETLPAASVVTPAGGRRGTRRLLKGGSSSGGWSSSRSSSGSYSSGSSYSSSRGGGYVSGASRSSFTSTATRTSYSTSYTTSTRTYGSRRYGGSNTYYVGNRYYYMGGSPYYYSYGYGWYNPGVNLFIVSRYSYGCYSCYGGYRTCYSCSGCTSRRGCSGGRTEQVLTQSYDRYELSVEFTVSPRWPLTLKLDNFTMFIPRGATGNPSSAPTVPPSGYFTFVTSDGDTFETIAGWCGAIGWITFVFCSIFIALKFGDLFPFETGSQRPRFTTQFSDFNFSSAMSYRPQTISQPIAMAQPTVSVAQPTVSVAQPMAIPMTQPVAQPTAQPVAVAQPVSGQQMMPVARYVSPPTSPPEHTRESGATKDE